MSKKNYRCVKNKDGTYGIKEKSKGPDLQTVLTLNEAISSGLILEENLR